MTEQLLLGAILISLTLTIQALIVGAVIFSMTRIGHWLATPSYFIKTVAILIAVVLWLVFGISINTWVWAFAFIQIGAFTALEPALYFSVVTFTTLGYGDVVLDEQWRLLASLTAVNGLIVFGLNTAFLVELLSRVSKAQVSNENGIS